MKLTVNGFPIYQAGNRQSKVQMVDQHVGRSLNTALIGEGNRLELSVLPYLRRVGSRLQVGSAELALSAGEQAVETAAVCVPGPAVDSAYAAWQASLDPVWTSVLRAEAAGRLGTASAIEAMRDSVAARPFELAATFDNERGPDFSALFEEAPVITDTSRLVDYALQLRDWMAVKDTNRLFAAFRPRYRAKYEAYDTPGSVEADRAFLRRAVVMDDPDLSFTEGDVRLTRWSDGRVWEISRNGEPLFFDNGAIREVYVGEVDGDLRVVR